MKLCQTCDQLLAETMTICPSCGDEVATGRQKIDDYRIVSVLQEGHASILCRAVKESTELPVLIRLFKDQAEMDEQIANRLQTRLEHLNQLPDEGFIKHYEIKKSSDNLWYRVSEWIEGEEWSRVFASGILKNNQIAFDLFHQIASSLAVLHESGHFIPHLVLNDIIVIKKSNSKLQAKIDYKLSRFLNHNPQLPGTMLNDLLVCHPDITNKKPLDFRSDIWSLGKIFVELLTADLGGCPVLSSISTLKIPREAKTLLKLMLSQDPSLRPQSMIEVANYLKKLKNQKTQKTKKGFGLKKSQPFLEIQKLRIRIWGLAAGFIVIFIGVLGGMSYLGFFKQDMESKFQEYANRYSNSVAFVLVEYSLVLDQNTVYKRRTEGTAFLVDEEGYLITNRHVAAPWLLDRDLIMIIQQMRRQQLDLQFDYKIYLWFEGQKAYKRIPILEANANLNDIYHLESAYHSHGKPRVEIAGMERSLVRQDNISRSPLKDDFAILKIDEVPDGLYPIPLDETMDPDSIKKLSPVITIGFPLGSRTQLNSVNVSVTKGNVRRTFKEFIQVDTSIYKGNSGGPIIDINGKVIGIATGIIFDTISGLMPVHTPLSDIGMVLPITKTVTFLQELKEGQSKWKGIIDISLDKKIEQIKQLALQGSWQMAQEQADNELKFSLEPGLFTAAGIMHFCNGDYSGAKKLFTHAISIDPGYYEVSFMLYLMDWLDRNYPSNPQRQKLLALDWRSRAEFYGFLTKVLEESIGTEEALSSWQNSNEKSWIYYITALVHYKNKKKQQADKLLEEGVKLAERDSWVLYLMLAELNQIHNQRIILTKGRKQKAKLTAETTSLHNSMLDAQNARIAQREELRPLYTRLLHPSVRIADKVLILNRILELDPANKETLISLVFFNGMEGEWETAMKHTKQFFLQGSRENKAYLSLKILELGFSKLLNKKDGMPVNKIEQTALQIKDPWYQNIVKTLANSQREFQLTEKALESPEYLLSAHFALGFWAEGNGKPQKAINHYKEVLGTYLDGWWEYEFSKMRIRNLRTKLNEPTQ
jgi:S1-C subfamily serine protease